MSEFQEIAPVIGPVSGRLRPPGSKSITNRALILAALANGHSKLTGVLESTDTRVMIESLNRLGIGVTHDADSCVCEVDGCGGQVPAAEAELWLENSGTSIRFLTALCSLGAGRYRLDGIARMRQRPIADLTDCLATLGASVVCEDPQTGCPPVLMEPGRRLTGGQAGIRGNISSQFLSAILMSAPCATQPVTLTVDGELVSLPYVDMTLRMMADFGVSVDRPDAATFCLPSQPYVARTYDVEPDASAASYFMGVAAVTGGSVTIDGLTKGALQGDVEFATALEQMGCDVQWHADSVTVIGRPLKGIDIDMNAISDTAQTLSTVAVFADGPTRIRSVEHMRHKETDRVSAVVTELRRAGITADEFDDGLTIHPGTPQPAEIHTYDDHRMAMSFALLGLKTAGIRILDPGCTAKTYPRFFDDLRALCGD